MSSPSAIDPLCVRTCFQSCAVFENEAFLGVDGSHSRHPLDHCDKNARLGAPVCPLPLPRHRHRDNP